MIRSLSLVSAALAITCATAHAESRESASTDRDPKVATALAIMGTALPATLFIAAAASPDHDTRGALVVTGAITAIVGPSFGNLYADGRGRGIAIRTAAVSLAAVIGIGSLMVDVAGDLGCSLGPVEAGGCESRSPDTGDAVMGVTLVMTGAVVVGSAIWDIATAGQHARQRNARFAIAPTMVSTGGAATAGLGLGFQF